MVPQTAFASPSVTPSHTPTAHQHDQIRRNTNHPITHETLSTSTTGTWAGKQARTKAAALSATLSRSCAFANTGRFSQVPSSTERSVDHTTTPPPSLSCPDLDPSPSSSVPSPPLPLGGRVEVLLTAEEVSFDFDRRRPPGIHSPSLLTFVTPACSPRLWMCECVDCCAFVCV